MNMLTFYFLELLGGSKFVMQLNFLFHIDNADSR